jgi:hypothetical protein
MRKQTAKYRIACWWQVFHRSRYLPPAWPDKGPTHPLLERQADNVAVSCARPTTARVVGLRLEG